MELVECDTLVLIEYPQRNVCLNVINVLLLELLLAVDFVTEPLRYNCRNNPLHRLILAKLLRHFKSKSAVYLVASVERRPVRYWELWVRLLLLDWRAW